VKFPKISRPRPFPLCQFSAPLFTSYHRRLIRTVRWFFPSVLSFFAFLRPNSVRPSSPLVRVTVSDVVRWLIAAPLAFYIPNDFLIESVRRNDLPPPFSVSFPPSEPLRRVVGASPTIRTRSFYPVLGRIFHFLDPTMRALFHLYFLFSVESFCAIH